MKGGCPHGNYYYDCESCKHAIEAFRRNQLQRTVWGIRDELIELNSRLKGEKVEI